MSGPGDPEWERRRAILRGEASKPDAGDDGGSYRGDGPSGENLGGPDIAGEDDQPDAGEDDEED